MAAQITRKADPRRVQDMVPCIDLPENLLPGREDVEAEEMELIRARDVLYDEFVADIACDIYGGLYKVDKRSDD